MKQTNKKTVIHCVATGVPKNFQSQRDYLASFVENENVLDTIESEKLVTLFKNTCIEKRHFSNSTNYLGNMSMEETMRAYVKDGTELAVSTVEKALKSSNAKPEEFGKIVFVTSTELQAPGLDVAIIDEIGLPRNISRTSVHMEGCGGGLKGLKFLNYYCLTSPGKKALLVCLELNNIHVKSGKYDWGYMVKRALFGDGCAAIVASGEDVTNTSGKWAIESNLSHMKPPPHIVTLWTNHKGFDGHISPDVPKYLKSALRPFVDRLLKEQNLTDPSEVDLWGIHPGGPSILRACQSALELNSEKLEESWDSLKNYGNMSAASIWFIIEKLLKKKDDNARTLLALGFGPGVNMEGVMLKKC